MSENEIKQASIWFYDYLNCNLNKDEFKIYKPMPSPIDKIQNRIRYRIIVKGNMNETANNILTIGLKQMYDKNMKNTKITIDINPNNMI